MGMESPRTLLGPYEITAQIGKGRNARVYRAIDPNTGGAVAVKIFSPKRTSDPNFGSYFDSLTQFLSTLRHRHILRLLDSGIHENLYYLVFPYVARRGLDVWLRQMGSIEPQSAVAVLDQAGSALDYAHRHGVTHGAVQPSNLMIADNGKILVSDFGIAALFPRHVQDSNGNWLAVIGSPAYMAPEIASTGTPSVEGDIYGLGVTLFEALTNQLPYSADTPLELIWKHQNDPIPAASTIRPTIPVTVNRVLAQAMAKSPEKRPRSAAEFSGSLQAAMMSSMMTMIAPNQRGEMLKGARSTSIIRETEVVETETRRQPAIPLWVIGLVAGACILMLIALLLVGGKALLASSQPPTPTATSPFGAVLMPTRDVRGSNILTPTPFIFPTLVPTPTDRPTYTPWPTFTPRTPNGPTETATRRPSGSTGGGTSGGGTGGGFPTPSGNLTYTPGAVFTLGVILPQTPGAPAGPSGNAVIFICGGQICAVNPDGSAYVQLTHDPGRQMHPTRSGQIAFASDRDGNSEIYTMATNGTGEVRITFDGNNDLDPTWTLDGLIVFSSTRSGAGDIYLMRVDGGIVSQPVNNPAQDRFPTGGPGGRIVFASNRDGGDFDLFAVNADGSNLSQLTANGTDDTLPEWSPDSGRIAYVAGGNVSVIDLATNASTPITRMGGVTGLSWSPDSGQIVFSSGGVLYIIGAGGGSPVRLTNGTDPAWAR